MLNEKQNQRRERRATKRMAKQQRRDEKRTRRLQRRQRLQWKLTRSYMMVTVTAVIVIELGGGWLIWYLGFREAPSPEHTASLARRVALLISAPLQQTPRSPEVARVLHKLAEKRMTAIVVGDKMSVLACAPENAARLGFPLSTQMMLPPAVPALIEAASRGETDPAHLSRKDADGSSLAVVAIPATNAQRQAQSFLYVKSATPVHLRDFTSAIVATVLLSGAIVGIFAAVVGTGFGYLTARRLTARLKAISSAADAWSRGEFSAFAPDSGEDELGELAQRLNRMAGELQQLVALRQNLATAEERNRLARELHDTVKQQVFATTMQVGAARVLVERDPALAQARLTEAERLAHEAQRELTAILEQLRPGSYSRPHNTNNSFEDVLCRCVADWSRQNNIVVNAQWEPLPTLAQSSQQALLRVVQEALSNIARHSGANEVLIRTTTLSGHVAALTIGDNGQGFDVSTTSGGMGLTSMRERVEALPNGFFRVQSIVGKGTRVEVRCSSRFEIADAAQLANGVQTHL
ncbi:MAG TPA: sensor histidine kinase [Abditibacteriaceae bacterium]|jgi:NarL family two-component system sensor histidine kinase LiaS